MKLENFILLMNSKRPLNDAEKTMMASLMHNECKSLQQVFAQYESEEDLNLFSAMGTVIALARKGFVKFDWLDNSVLIRCYDEEKELAIVEH